MNLGIGYLIHVPNGVEDGHRSQAGSEWRLRVDSGPAALRQFRPLPHETIGPPGRRVSRAAGLRRAEYGTLSLRRTKASIIYKAAGNLRDPNPAESY